MNLLNQTIDTIYNSLTDQQKECIKKQGTDGLHFGFGTNIRNKFNLWDLNGDINKWFKNNLGISHGDDISGTILEGLYCKIIGKEFDAKAHVQKYIEHWQKYQLKGDDLGGIINFSMMRD